MQIPQTRPLALAYIAKLWAAELRDTPLEQHPEMLLDRMRSALIEGELVALHAPSVRAGLVSRSRHGRRSVPAAGLTPQPTFNLGTRAI